MAWEWFQRKGVRYQVDLDEPCRQVTDALKCRQATHFARDISWNRARAAKLKQEGADPAMVEWALRSMRDSVRNLNLLQQGKTVYPKPKVHVETPEERRERLAEERALARYYRSEQRKGRL